MNGFHTVHNMQLQKLGSFIELDTTVFTKEISYSWKCHKFGKMYLYYSFSWVCINLRIRRLTNVNLKKWHQIISFAWIMALLYLEYTVHFKLLIFITVTALADVIIHRDLEKSFWVNQKHILMLRHGLRVPLNI